MATKSMEEIEWELNTLHPLVVQRMETQMAVLLQLQEVTMRLLLKTVPQKLVEETLEEIKDIQGIRFNNFDPTVKSQSKWQ